MLSSGYPHLITWSAPEPRLVGWQGSAARGTAWVLLADMAHPPLPRFFVVNSYVEWFYMFTEQGGCSDSSDSPEGDCWGAGPVSLVSEGEGLGCCLPCSVSLCSRSLSPCQRSLC